MLFKKTLIYLSIISVFCAYHTVRAVNDNMEPGSTNITTNFELSKNLFKVTRPVLGSFITAPRILYQIGRNAADRTAIPFTAIAATSLALSQQKSALSLMLLYGGYHGYALKNDLIKNQEENFNNTSSKLEDLEKVSNNLLKSIEDMQQQIKENNKILESNDVNNPGLIAQTEQLNHSLQEALKTFAKIEEQQVLLQNHINKLNKNFSAEQSKINSLNQSINEQNALVTLFRPRLSGFQEQINQNHEERVVESNKLEAQTAKANETMAELLLQAGQLEQEAAWHIINSELATQSIAINELKNNNSEIIRTIVYDHHLENKALMEAANREIQHEHAWHQLLSYATAKKIEHEKFLNSYQQRAKKKFDNVNYKFQNLQTEIQKIDSVSSKNKCLGLVNGSHEC